MNGEPTRLVEDSSVRDELRQRLASEAGIKPHYDFEQGLARLRATIANIPSGSSGPDSDAPGAKLSVANYAVKGSVWKVAGVVGLAGTAVIVGVRAWSPTTHVGRMEGGAAAPAMASPPSQVDEPDPAHVGAPVAAAEPAAEQGTLVNEPAAAAPPSHDPKAATRARDADKLREEVNNLAQIRAALAADPETALALSEDGNRRFPGGVLQEEREASAIRSLAALGRESDARRRARRFLENYPKSPFAERVRLSARL